MHLISADWVDPLTQTAYDGKVLRLQQTTKLRQIARDWFEGSKNHFGIIAGDFNAQPTTEAIDKMYDAALGGNGDFTEYNRSGSSRDGQMTAHADADNDSGMAYDKKIDYVFLSTNRVAIDGPAVDIKKDASDHDMVTSTARMRR